MRTLLKRILEWKAIKAIFRMAGAAAAPICAIRATEALGPNQGTCTFPDRASLGPRKNRE